MNVSRALIAGDGEINMLFENLTVTTDRITSGIAVTKTCEQQEMTFIKLKNITFSSDSFLQIAEPLIQLQSNSDYDINQLTFNV